MKILKPMFICRIACMNSLGNNHPPQRICNLKYDFQTFITSHFSVVYLNLLFEFVISMYL